MKKKLKPNPFYLGRPIQDPDEFVSRNEILEKIFNGMSKLQNISLLGERRLGKTSILLFIADPTAAESYGLSRNHISVFIDFQQYSQSTENEVWCGITDSILAVLKTRLSPEVSEELLPETTILSEIANPSNIRKLLSKLGRHGYFLHLLFDEFDQIADQGLFSHSFFKNLRSFTTSQTPSLSYIIASRLPINQIEPRQQNSSSFFNIFASEYLSVFSENEAKELIYGSFSRAEINISSEKKIEQARRLWKYSEVLHEFTGYHPYFLQALCYRLYECMDEPEWPIGIALSKALKQYFQDVEPVLKDYWELSSTDEQDLLSRIADKTPVFWGSTISESARNHLSNRALILPIDTEAVSWEIFSLTFQEWIRKRFLDPNYADYYVRNFSGGGTKRSEKMLHIYTGAKGGVGKTLLSIVTALLCLKKGKVLCIDLNWENPDLSRVLAREQEWPVVSKGSQFQSIKVNANLLLLRSPLRFMMPEGSLGFWESIRSALRQSYEIDKFDPDFVIVDTNMHVASLLRRSTYGSRKRISKRINDLVRESQIRNLYLWYSWTVTSLNPQSYDPTDVQTVLTMFDQTLEDYYFGKENFINVLNLFVLNPLYPNSDINASKSSFLQLLADSEVGESLDLYPMIECAQKGMEDKSLNNPDERREAIENFSKEILIRADGKRPVNLIVIPKCFPEITGFLDVFMSGKLKNLTEVETFLQPVANYLSRYLDDLFTNKRVTHSSQLGSRKDL